VQNISVISQNSILAESGGWIGQQYFGKGLSTPQDLFGKIPYLMRCCSNGSMLNPKTGGLVGANSTAFVNKSFSTGRMIGAFSGGIFGDMPAWQSGAAIITRSYSRGTCSVSPGSGGMLGGNSSGTSYSVNYIDVENSYCCGPISGAYLDATVLSQPGSPCYFFSIYHSYGQTGQGWNKAMALSELQEYNVSPVEGLTCTWLDDYSPTLSGADSTPFILNHHSVAVYGNNTDIILYREGGKTQAGIIPASSGGIYRLVSINNTYPSNIYPAQNQVSSHPAINGSTGVISIAPKMTYNNYEFKVKYEPASPNIQYLTVSLYWMLVNNVAAYRDVTYTVLKSSMDDITPIVTVDPATAGRDLVAYEIHKKVNINYRVGPLPLTDEALDKMYNLKHTVSRTNAGHHNINQK
jgi:hypothetical protein